MTHQWRRSQCQTFSTISRDSTSIYCIFFIRVEFRLFCLFRLIVCVVGVVAIGRDACGLKEVTFLKMALKKKIVWVIIFCCRLNGDLAAFCGDSLCGKDKEKVLPWRQWFLLGNRTVSSRERTRWWLHRRLQVSKLFSNPKGLYWWFKVVLR